MLSAIVIFITKRLQVPCRKLAVANRHGQVLGGKKNHIYHEVVGIFKTLLAAVPRMAETLEPAQDPLMVTLSFHDQKKTTENRGGGRQ